MIQLPDDLPTFPLTAIEQRQAKLFADGFSDYVGKSLVGDVFHSLVTEVRSVLGGVSHDAVFESLRHLAGEVLTERSGTLTAWRLAANLGLLRKSQAVCPWTRQSQDEWVPILFLSCRPERTRYGRVAWAFTAAIVGGTPCGMTVTISLTGSACVLVARRAGYSRHGGKFVYRNHADLVGLRFVARILAARSQTAPYIGEIHCPPTFVQWNRKTVLGLRCRQGQKCPNAWSHPCHLCAVGYETCPAATHYRTYIQQMCPRCGREDAVADPDRLVGVCLACELQQVMQGDTNHVRS